MSGDITSITTITFSYTNTTPTAPPMATRTEEGYCGIEWREVSGTTPDAFQVFASASTVAVVVCPTMYVYIPGRPRVLVPADPCYQTSATMG